MIFDYDCLPTEDDFDEKPQGAISCGHAADQCDDELEAALEQYEAEADYPCCY